MSFVDLVFFFYYNMVTGIVPSFLIADQLRFETGYQSCRMTSPWRMPTEIGNPKRVSNRWKYLKALPWWAAKACLFFAVLLTNTWYSQMLPVVIFFFDAAAMQECQTVVQILRKMNVLQGLWEAELMMVGMSSAWWNKTCRTVLFLSCRYLCGHRPWWIRPMIFFCGWMIRVFHWLPTSMTREWRSWSYYARPFPKTFPTWPGLCGTMTRH